MKPKKVDFLIAAAGIALLAAGLALLWLVPSPDGLLRVLPYICIGLGSGLFGHGSGNLLAQKALQNAPETARQLEIEKNDERNLALSARAKGKAFDVMTFVFGALMLCFALMQVDRAAVLLLVFAYLFVEGSAVYYRCKYEKEM